MQQFDRAPRAGGWKRPVLVAGMLVGGALLGAGGMAAAAVMPTGPGEWHRGPRLEAIQFMVRRQLDAVGATSAQEAKVHDIAAAAFTDLQQNGMDRAAVRQQALDLLRAPTLDRAAMEKLRAEQVAKFDAMSKTLTSAVLDAADQLTPQERTQLADRMAMMAARGPRGPMEGRGGPMGGWRGRGPGPEHGPDGAPPPPPHG